MTEKTEIKLTEEEIQIIDSMRESYANTTAKFGQLQIERILIETQLKKIADLETRTKAEYLDTQLKEEEFAATILKKYGDGNINLEAGTFISI
jgi:hypothetical protein